MKEKTRNRWKMTRSIITRQIYPEPTVGGLIFNPSGKIFLMVSPKWFGRYTLPGGHIELGETAEQALKREIKEEAGLNISGVKFLMWQEFISGKEFYKKKHFIFLDFICKTKSTDAMLDGVEGTSFVWVTIDKALKLNLGSSTRVVILEYKKRYLSSNN
jgi:nucleoside triphosphatase